MELRSRCPRLKILYTGQGAWTCLQRARALRDLGHEVLHVTSGIPPLSGSLGRVCTFQLYRAISRIKRYPDLFFANRRLLLLARSAHFDVVWVDKGLTIHPGTLRRLREYLPHVHLISYSPDDMFNRANQSPEYLDSIRLYDLHVTTKSYNVDELRDAGARDVMFVDNAYDPNLHRPMSLTAEERSRFSAEVSFIGAYERERAGFVQRLAESGVPITVRGPGWGRVRSSQFLAVADRYFDGEDYARAVCASKINLGFLRKANRDLQTTRSVEIPACGGFLLAERTVEHRRLFREGAEAEFFSSFDEVRAKCLRYLADHKTRQDIARAGLRRCATDGYCNQSRLSRVLAHLIDTERKPEGRPERAA